MLFEGCQGRYEVMELGVHQSNERAHRLYLRLGFEEVRFRSDVGYFILQKRLSAAPEG